MIIMSFNTQEEVSAHKRLALERLFNVYNLDLIMVQDTMCYGRKVIDALSTFIRYWTFCSLDADELSRELVTSWSNSFDLISSSTMSLGILIKLVTKELGFDLKLLNVYGPYSDRRTYWDNLVESRVFRGNNVIVKGGSKLDFAFEIYLGEATKKDPLGYFFSHLFGTDHLFDIEPIKLVPTQRNAKRGREGISKRLDRLLLEEDLLNDSLILKYWVGSRGISNHLPILFKPKNEDYKPPNPTKFNHALSLEEELRNIVISNWIHVQ
jgi:hypothetical protein